MFKDSISIHSFFFKIQPLLLFSNNNSFSWRSIIALIINAILSIVGDPTYFFNFLIRQLILMTPPSIQLHLQVNRGQGFDQQ